MPFFIKPNSSNITFFTFYQQTNLISGMEIPEFSMAGSVLPHHHPPCARRPYSPLLVDRMEGDNTVDTDTRVENCWAIDEVDTRAR